MIQGNTIDFKMKPHHINKLRIVNRLKICTTAFKLDLTSLTISLLTLKPHRLIAMGFERYLDPKHRSTDVSRRSTKMIEAIGSTVQNIVIAKTADQVFNRIMNIKRKTPEDQAPNVIYVSANQVPIVVVSAGKFT